MILCHCGCGELLPELNKRGEISRFKHGHNSRVHKERPERRKPRICLCGCETVIALSSREASSRRYVDGHQPTMSQSGRQNISNAQKVRVRLPLSAEHRQAISCGHRRKLSDDVLRLRSNLYLARRSTAYKEWKLFVLERDDYTCQLCGFETIDASEVHVHHIAPVAMSPGLMFEPTNGIVLCPTCHRKLHRMSLVKDRREHVNPTQ